jgi:nucleoside-diphosphate-sugar epimerase
MTNSVHITGCAGFVGKALCTELKRRSFLAFSGSDRGACLENSNTGSQPYVAVEDIGPDTDWSNALTGADTVIHLAARAHVLRENAVDPLAEFRKVNRDGALNLAGQAVARGIRRFVFMSSIGVNGEITGDGGSTADARCMKSAFSEDNQAQPHSAYAVAKWEAEQGLVEIARKSGMELVILRAPLVYGPGVKGNFERLVRLIYRGVPLPFGLVRNQRSFIAMGNLVDLLLRCAIEPAAGNQLFVISDGDDVSTPDLVRRIARVLNKPARLLPVPVGMMRLGAACMGKSKMFQQLCGSLVVDSAKVRRVLGWKPPMTMEQGLAETAAWFLKRS